MARRVRDPRLYRRAAPPVSDRDFGDALCSLFSRAEVAEMFHEAEAKMAETVYAICAEAKKTREAEFGILPEDGSVPRLQQGATER